MDFFWIFHTLLLYLQRILYLQRKKYYANRAQGKAILISTLTM